MPRKFSHTVFPANSFGRVNSLRYHHETAYGLSGGIGRFEKFAPIGYPMPGYFRRFMPSKGSGSCPFFTWAATTVAGTLALIQFVVGNAAVEMASPFSPAFAEDCNAQPSPSDNFASPGCEPACASAGALAT